jgi:hypothetical protein
MDAFFCVFFFFSLLLLIKKREGEKAEQTMVLLEKGDRHWGLVQLAWSWSWSWSWQGRAGQGRTIVPAGPSQGAKGAG